MAQLNFPKVYFRKEKIKIKFPLLTYDEPYVVVGGATNFNVSSRGRLSKITLR